VACESRRVQVRGAHPTLYTLDGLEPRQRRPRNIKHINPEVSTSVIEKDGLKYHCRGNRRGAMWVTNYEDATGKASSRGFKVIPH
jgi:hypothetical protein